MFPANPEVWSTTFAPLNNMSSFIQSDKLVPLAPYVSAESKLHHHAVFGNDYSAPCTWYKRGIANLGIDAELAALDEGIIKDKLSVKTLLITGSNDRVCLSDKAKESMNAFVKGGLKGELLKVVDLDAGHWINLERAKETNAALLEFFESDRMSGAGRSVL